MSIDEVIEVISKIKAIDWDAVDFDAVKTAMAEKPPGPAVTPSAVDVRRMLEAVNWDTVPGDICRALLQELVEHGALSHEYCPHYWCIGSVMRPEEPLTCRTCQTTIARGI